MQRVDTRRFQFGVISNDDPEYDQLEERRLLDEFAQRAKSIVLDQPWAPPIEDILLAFGLGRIIGLYLVRFAHPFLLDNGDRRDEIWLVLGDVPVLFFTTETSQTRAGALRAYCDMSEEWANAVLAGDDLSDCADIPAEPTAEHARMLKSRVVRIRRDFIPYIEDTADPGPEVGEPTGSS